LDYADVLTVSSIAVLQYGSLSIGYLHPLKEFLIAHSAAFTSFCRCLAYLSAMDAAGLFFSKILQQNPLALAF